MSEQEPDILPENPANPDPELFYELISTTTLTLHHISQPYSPSTPLYCAKKHASFSKKPDVTIHRGNSNAGAVLGVVRLGLREYAIGIGNPEALLEEGNVDERVVWERLLRSNNWNHKAYEFEYENGVGGGTRMKFTWRWTNPWFLRVPRDLELRVGSPRDGEGELVSRYRKTDWWFVKRGSFFIKRRYSDGGEEQGEEQRKKWELVVLLTAQGFLRVKPGGRKAKT
jgi:hypothetical protein